MLLAERLLFAPSPDAVNQAIDAVLTQAREKRPIHPLAVPADVLHARVRDAVLAAPEGDQCWQDAHLTEYFVGLRVVWVSDYGQRRHYRIQAVRRQLDETGVVVSALPEASRTPSELIYAQHAYLFRPGVGAEADFLVGCSCGEVGTPEEIAWMGDRCGPCHDRAESGEPLPEPCARHQRAPRDPVSNEILGRTLAVLPDGQSVLILRARRHGEAGQDEHSLVLWDLEHQRSRLRWTIGPRHIGVNLSPDGSCLGMIYPRGAGVQLDVFDWPGPSRTDGAAVARSQILVPGEPRCFTMAPFGRTAYLGNMRGVVVVDLTHEPPTFEPLVANDDEPLDLACSADDRWLAIHWRQAGLVLIDRATGQTAATFTLPVNRPRGVLAFTPDSRHLFACDDVAGIWCFAVPELKLLGRFETERLTINGLDVCGPWLALQPLASQPVHFWPWEILLAYARRQAS